MVRSASALLESPPVVRRRGGHALLLSELFPPDVGGSAVLFEGIYSRLPDAEVTVLTHGAGEGPWRPQEAGPLRVFRHPLATKRWGVRDIAALHHHFGVARRVRELVPRRHSVVHCARALPEGLAALFSRLSGGPPYVCWAHGEDLATALLSREFTFLTRMVFARSAAALANSRNTASMLLEFGVPDEKIHVVHPAVDADRFHPGVDGMAVRSRFASPSDIVLLSVGRLQRRKGQDVGIQAVAALKDEIPGLRYVIAGDGEERGRLEQLIREHGVMDRVTLTGVIPDGQLSAYYAACDIFLLPNRVEDGDIEGFGIVFLEAAAAGKPAIGGNSGGVPEAVEHDVTGLLVDGSVLQVVAAIRALANSEERRRRMGLAGRVRARGCFSWQRAAATVSQLQFRLAGHEPR
jgi:phosphatidylinositol alpha-1,6-mannosyltransferase